MVTAFPVVGKRKSFDICQAFLQGCKDKSQDAAVFYGVNETNIGVWTGVRKNRRTFYYIDNSYFDETRGTHFRVTKNEIQYTGMHVESTGERLRGFFNEADLKPWKPAGGNGHVVVCPQSDVFMSMIVGYRGNWLKDTLEMCNRKWPNNPVVLRAWSADKVSLAKNLKQDLEDAARLVTHTSAAAVTAVMEGVPVAVDPMHALCNWGFDAGLVDRRLPALRVLADNQWTLDEIRAGVAWQWLNQ